MEEVDDELEPLFDYSRVQPIEFVPINEDCSDSSPICIGKRKRNPTSTQQKKPEEVEVLHVSDDDENKEEDWLPPPPKVSNYAKRKLDDNSFILDMRSKKQELASLTAQSAEEVFRAVEESVTKQFRSSGKSDLESGHQPVQSLNKRDKIIISIQDKDGLKQFRLYLDDKFEKLFKMYSEKVNVRLESLVFCFDGDKVNPTTTPSSLGLEDDDIIEVHLKTH